MPGIRHVPTRPAPPKGEAPGFEERLRAACAALCPDAETGESTALLAALVEGTGATRASILALNPATGRLTIVAALGLRQGLLGQELPPRPRSISEWVFRNRRGLVLNGEVRDPRFEAIAGPDHIESALSLPLVAGGDPVGVLNLARVSPAPVFGEAEMAALVPKIEPVASALRRWARVRATLGAGKRHATAATAAGSPLMPCGLSEFKNYEMALAHRPAIVPGSDLCDRVPHPGGDHSLLVLDVPGRGGVAAATAGFVHGLFLPLDTLDRPLSTIAARLGAEVHQRLGPERSSAAWLARLSTLGELSYCNAGHSWPLWVPADGSEVVRLDRGGPPLGCLPAATYEEERLRLLPGDLVLVASDGVLGARGTSDQPFGGERLAELLPALLRQPLGRIAESVIEATVEFSGRPVPADDLTVLALRFHSRD
jgi:hypothetical protein